MKNFTKIIISSAAVFVMLLSCAHFSDSRMGQDSACKEQAGIQVCFVPAEWEDS